MDFVRHDDDAMLVTLPGERRYRTLVWLVVGAHHVVVESFVCRRPDENTEQVYRFLLQRNAKLYGVHYTVDSLGDIYLVGRFGKETMSADELDKVLGQVLEAADGDFNTLLEIGFATSIKREWDWRVSRGESLANLQAFKHLVAPEKPHEPGLTES